MTNSAYVISIKKVKDYKSNILSEKDQYYEYLGFDPLSGFPDFAGFNINPCCKTFTSIENAIKYFDEVKKCLREVINFDWYDLSTLGIRKRIITYKTERKLTI
jgi:hypothetical protein